MSEREREQEVTDGLQQLARVFGVDLVDLFLQLQDLLSLDGDVCGLTLNTSQRNDHVYRLSNPLCLVSDQYKEVGGAAHPGAP